MTEQNSEKCDCSKNCGCGSKTKSLLLSFMLLVIIILLSGIFYSMQEMMAMCPAMKASSCQMSKGKMAMCPLMGKSAAIPPAQ
ncbi:MAG: hypothetical protein IT395_02050 [Candidatus Omnitrophica bacterium]|nr:hypothetical protein [Candidatus Omnitrophota bacterium]